MDFLALGFSGALALLSGPTWGEVRLQVECVTNAVGKYEPMEFRLQVPGAYANPFDPDEVDVQLQLTTPGGRRLSLPAFFCQNYERRLVGESGRQRDWLYPVGSPVWKARFAPMEIGRYEAVATLTNRSGGQVSAPVRFRCAESNNPGFVRVSHADPRFFELSEGRPFFPLGQNLAFIGSQQYLTLAKAEAVFARLAENGANYLRVWTCCEDWAMALEARKSAWGRSWNWRPPIVAVPGGRDARRRCVTLAGDGARLDVNPSHPVALRPGTRYVARGKIMTSENATVRLEAHRTQSEPLRSGGTDQGWLEFRHEFTSGPTDFWLAGMTFRSEGTGAVWIDDLSLQEASGGPELLGEADVNRPIRGFYNPLDCFMLDELVRAAGRHGLYLQLCLLTRDLYMDGLKDAAGPDYAQATADARKLLRYAVARWGYSTSVAAWEYFNEMNPGLPSDRFYAELGAYLEQIDPYRHLRTTSTWGPSPKDCRHPQLDIADVHFYLRPADKGRLTDEVEAVVERTRWLREQAPRKPAHLGEFGLANDQWQPREGMKESRELADFHNALWASALSGASGSALFWWWDRLDPLDAYPHYRPLSVFLADVPWTSGALRPAAARASDPLLRVVGLQGKGGAWLWLFDSRASWLEIVAQKRTPAEVRDVQLEVRGLAPGRYRVQWWDTRAGRTIREDSGRVTDTSLRLPVPAFTRDVACALAPTGSARRSK